MEREEKRLGMPMCISEVKRPKRERCVTTHPTMLRCKNVVRRGALELLSHNPATNGSGAPALRAEARTKRLCRLGYSPGKAERTRFISS